jgi:hypothetical protein
LKTSSTDVDVHTQKQTLGQRQHKKCLFVTFLFLGGEWVGSGGGCGGGWVWQGGQVTAELIHYHLPDLGFWTRTADSGAAEAAASPKTAKMDGGALERTPPPEARSGPMMRIGFSLPLPVRSPQPETMEAAPKTARISVVSMEQTPEPEANLARSGPMMRFGYSLPLPMRSPQPESIEAASAAEETFQRPRDFNPTTSAVARGNIGPLAGELMNYLFHGHQAALFELPSSTPEPMALGEKGSSLGISQPRFLHSPTGPSDFMPP